MLVAGLKKKKSEGSNKMCFIVNIGIKKTSKKRLTLDIKFEIKN